MVCMDLHKRLAHFTKGVLIVSIVQNDMSILLSSYDAVPDNDLVVCLLEREPKQYRRTKYPHETRWGTQRRGSERPAWYSN